MAILAKGTASGLDQVVCLKVTWNAYQSLVDGMGDRSRAHLTYDGETLEIMSPGTLHERYANRLSELMSVIMHVWQVDFENVGSTTLQAEPKGFEADKTYYITNAPMIRDLVAIDLTVDPAPDLVVEIDVTTSKLERVNKLKLYAELKIPEFWRYKPGVTGLEGLALVDGSYAHIETSRVIDGLPLKELQGRIEQLNTPLKTVTNEWRRWLEKNKGLHRAD